MSRLLQLLRPFNISVVILAVVALSLLVDRYIAVRQSTLPSEVTLGERLNLDLTNRSRPTLILALSTNCGYCSRNAPLYQRLSRYRQEGARGLHISAIFPKDDSAADLYLANRHIAVDEVRHVDFSTLEIHSTPTLIIIDSQQIVRNVWVGFIVGVRERELIQALDGLVAADTHNTSAALELAAFERGISME